MKKIEPRTLSLMAASAGMGLITFLSLSANASPPISGESATQAFEALKLGNQRFTSHHLRDDGEAKSDVERLSHGQNPRAIVLSCSDSRVPPELVFDQKLGEIFTVRTAGETLSPEVIASIEYAVAKLGSHLIVVMGHTNCGAVKAAVETMEGSSAGSPSLDQLVSDIHPSLKGKVDPHKPSEDFKLESWLNAREVAAGLVKRSPILTAAIRSGQVTLKVGLYSLSTGGVEFQ